MRNGLFMFAVLRAIICWAAKYHLENRTFTKWI